MADNTPKADSTPQAGNTSKADSTPQAGNTPRTGTTVEMKPGPIVASISVAVMLVLAGFGGSAWMIKSGDEATRELVKSSNQLVESNRGLIRSVEATLSDLTRAVGSRDNAQDLTISELNATLVSTISNLGDRIEKSNGSLRQEIRDLGKTLTASFQKDLRDQGKHLDEKFEGLGEKLEAIEKRILFELPYNAPAFGAPQYDTWLNDLKNQSGNWAVYNKEDLERLMSGEGSWILKENVRWKIFDTGEVSKKLN